MNAPPIFESADHVLDLVTSAVERPVMFHGTFGLDFDGMTDIFGVAEFLGFA
jgi:hypothetical protein